MSISLSTVARKLVLQLGADTGLPVEARWDSSDGRGWRWHLLWNNGATAAEMNARAAALLTGTALDVERLGFLRIVQPLNCALAMVVNVRDGLPPLGVAGMRSWKFEDRMQDVSYRERVGIDEDRQLAAVLSQVSRRTREDMPALLERIGLDGLRGALNPVANVVDINSRRHRQRAGRADSRVSQCLPGRRAHFANRRPRHHLGTPVPSHRRHPARRAGSPDCTRS